MKTEHIPTPEEARAIAPAPVGGEEKNPCDCGHGHDGHMPDCPGIAFDEKEFIKPQPTGAGGEALRERIANVLRETAYCCTRVWDAWQVGTMTEDDFHPAWEDDDLLNDLEAIFTEAQPLAEPVKPSLKDWFASKAHLERELAEWQRRAEVNKASWEERVRLHAEAELKLAASIPLADVVGLVEAMEGQSEMLRDSKPWLEELEWILTPSQSAKLARHLEVLALAENAATEALAAHPALANAPVLARKPAPSDSDP